jgi:thiol:disulfide interchange protein
MTSVGDLATTILIALLAIVVVLGVVFYAVMQQRAAIDESKTPSLPPKPPPPSPSVSGHTVVHLQRGQPLAEQLRTHASAAETRGLRPFFEVGAIWCPPSKLFGDALDDPRMQTALAGVYLIRADMDVFEGDPKLSELRVMSVPVFFELDAEGQATGRSMTGAAWGTDTIENMSAAMAKFCG